MAIPDNLFIISIDDVMTCPIDMEQCDDRLKYYVTGFTMFNNKIVINDDYVVCYTDDGIIKVSIKDKKITESYCFC